MNIAGAIALAAGSDYQPNLSSSTLAYASDINLGNSSFVRVSATSSSFLGLTGITDLTGTSTSHKSGRMITLVNASSTAGFTIFNQHASSSAANRIITGNGGDLSVGADASINLIYDGAAARWRVVGGSGGGATSVVQNVTASSTLTGWDKTVYVDTTLGNITITLPSAVGNGGHQITVKKISSDAYSVTVVGAAGQYIDSASTTPTLTSYL